MLKVKKNGAVLVVFTLSTGSYPPGKLAGFAEPEAERLVKTTKVARFAKPSDIPDFEKKKHLYDTVRNDRGGEAVAPARALTDEQQASSAPEGKKGGAEKKQDEGAEDHLAPVKEAIAKDEDWRELNGSKLMAIARRVSDDPVSTKADAVEIISEVLGEDEEGSGKIEDPEEDPDDEDDSGE